MDLVRRHRPPTIPSPHLVVIVVLFAALTIVRGVGWVTAEPGTTMAVVVADGLSRARLTPSTWGVTMIVTGAAVILAYLVRIHVLAFLAHGLAAVVYLTVTVGIAQAAIAIGSGWQHAGPVLGGAVWHAYITWRTKPLPPRPATEGAPGAAYR